MLAITAQARIGQQSFRRIWGAKRPLNQLVIVVYE